MSEFFGWQRILLITGIGLFFYGKIGRASCRERV